MIPYEILFFLLGGAVAYIFVHWRYRKEMDIRLKWMKKILVKKKKGNWKIIVAVMVTLNISTSLIKLIFSTVPDNYFLKPFFYSLFVIPIFVLLLFKHFYEIIGGKREWKL
jgi:hypothetical protein